MILLSSNALRYLPMIILHLVIVAYLLNWQHKSTTTWWLIGWQSSLFLLATSFFIAGFIYAPVSANIHWWGGAVFGLMGAIFMIQFVYRFPRQFYFQESRLVLWLTLGLLGLLIAAIVVQMVWLPRLQLYNFGTNQFEVYLPGVFSAYTLFDITHAALFVWMTALWGRKSITLSRQTPAIAGGASWWQLLIHPRGSAARVSRNFILWSISGMAAGISVALEARNLVPIGSFAVIYLLIWAGVILTYANNNSEFISFVAKLVIIVLVILLVIIEFSYMYLLNWHQNWFDAVRHAELALLEPRLTGAPLTDLPEPITYVAARPLADGLFSSQYRLLFSRQPNLTPTFLAEQGRRVQTALAQGQDFVALREYPWLAETGLPATEWSELTHFPPGVKMYRGVLDGPPGHFVRYAFIRGDTLYEVGFDYTTYRQTLHQRSLPMVYVLVLSVLAVLLIFPRFLQHVLVQPLDRLLTGVGHMQAGHLQIDIPITNPDEIGFLTHSFNHMAASLHSLNQGLRQKIEEQNRTQRDLQSSETRFAQVVTSVNDHIYMSELDEAGHRVNKFISPNVEKLTGYPPQNFLDDWYFWNRQLIHPDDQAAAQNFSARLDSGQPAELECRLVRANGQVIWVRDSAKAEKLADKVVVYGVISDITARKQAQLERQKLLVTTRQAFARLAQAEEDEREQLARELHDRIGQNLMALNLNLSAVRAGLLQTESAPVDDLAARLADSTQLLKETSQIVRNVMNDLRSPVLDTYGLLAALEWYGQQVSARSGLIIEVDGDAPAPRPAAAIENALFRITQEALTNTLKHAAANRVTITLTARQQRLRLVIVDDGQGFALEKQNEPGQERHGLGLLTIRERAEAIGGVCRISSVPNVGTQVIVEVSL